VRLWRTAVLLGLALLWFLLGPLVPLVALASLAHPRVRRAWRPTPRVVAGWALAAVVLTGLVVVAPDGLLPLPSGSGALVTPGYTGRPVTAQPLSVVAPDAGTDNGPLGLSPEVDSALYGTDQCGGLVFTSGGRLVALCGEADDQRLRVVDADTLRPLAGKDLPDPPDEAGAEACDVSFHLDGLDRVVVPTADRRILVVATADGAGEADLTTEETHDLTGVVPEGDCLLAVRPDSDDRTWFVTRQGRAGFVDPLGGPPRLLELGEEVDGGVYVVTQAALHRLDVRRGEPVATWRSAYERGSGRKPGQRSQGSGSPAAVLADGLVAITDNANPRMHVVVHDAADGARVCQSELFDDDASAAEGSLVAVGRGVVVANTHGYDGPLRTLLGRVPAGGLARVDVVGRECVPAWTSPAVAPSATPAVAPASGLLYAWTKRRSWWGVDAWYLSALDVRTGRPAFSVRTGRSPLHDTHRSALTLGPDGAAYAATLAGLVRVRDERR
jgi:hypothetical protein